MTSPVLTVAADALAGAGEPVAAETPSARGATPSPHAPVLRWYRTPIAREDMKAVLARSNLLASLHTGGFLAIIAATGAATLWAGSRHLWWALPVLILLHGTVMSFMINAVHEFGHETVFTSRRLNRFFAACFAFPAWINHLHFAESHGRHHRYTLHAPADLEVTLPITIGWKDFWRAAIINVDWARWSIVSIWAHARGRFEGPWNAVILPEGDHERRRPVIRWARIVLIGHLLILAVSLWRHWWLVPVVVSVAPIFGGWLQWLCNNTQHVGMCENIADARQGCRTFLLHPLPRLLYWQMNYHVEHHMFAAVPCYRLAKLHRLMRHDLPPTPNGLVATWREIMAIMRRQREEPAYRQRVLVPAPVGAAG